MSDVDFFSLQVGDDGGLALLESRASRRTRHSNTALRFLVTNGHGVVVTPEGSLAEVDVHHGRRVDVRA